MQSEAAGDVTWIAERVARSVIGPIISSIGKDVKRLNFPIR